MDDMTAAGSYGFRGYTPIDVQGNLAQTTAGMTSEAVTQVASNIGHTNSPLFWLLLLALVWTGYVFGSFEVGVKKIGSVNASVGE